jgi:hypothetical protein
VACSAIFRDYNIRHGINAHVYTAHSSSPSDQVISDVSASPTQLSTAFSSHLLSYVYSASIDSPPLHATPSADNKSDILMQSQMFKADDKDQFIRCQQDEINTL